jgi:hypothetical protein
MKKLMVVFVLGLILAIPATASKLMKVAIVDRNYLMVTFSDGDVTYIDDGLGEGAFETRNDPQNNIIIRYGLPLDTDSSVQPKNWKIVSSEDPSYGIEGLIPLACYRKSKMNGMAQMEWKDKDFRYEYTMEHTIFIKLPKPLVQGKTYSLLINSNTNSHLSIQNFTYDVFNQRSEAIHTNLVGYPGKIGIKACDLYLWLGDGGIRNYSEFEGNTAWLYDVNKKISVQTSKVTFWKKAAIEQNYYDQTGSDVWNADFNAMVEPGKYRIVIDGVGCSEDFVVDDQVYFSPFQISTLGFFYMRIGQDSPEMTPVPRRPLWIPQKSPANTEVIITSMHPYHPQWKTFSTGDVWDRPEHWAAFAKPGNKTNKIVFGGHSDALDWDRHLGHVSIIYDMLLPFILTGGAIDDDNLGIAESGNGIPDILDETRNEVDFWLMLRDGKGYSHGITNPDRQNRLFQAENTGIAAWANAANCAMLSHCFQIAGLDDLMKTYRDSAITAYKYAGSLSDPMLDKVQDVGDIRLTGLQFKLIAAAYLYNVTGLTTYEDDLQKGSLIKSGTAVVLDKRQNELWTVAGYLMTKQKINYPELYNNMKSSIINEARINEANYMLTRPSRRGTDEATGYFKTEENMQRTIIAHAVTKEASEKAFFEKALVLEADWGLGRNPLNIIQMTTATTSLSNKRSIEYAYTAGRDDGTPGMDPGHTPYLNTDDWGNGMIMSRPGWMTAKCHPEFAKWPKSEGYFKTPYVWAHSEFTPQQTMRGKMALYGYLYGLSKL